MATLWVRIGLMVALIGAVFIGVWDFFRNPTPETAVAILMPTVEEVERAKEITDPVVDFVSRQDEDSVRDLVNQARVEFNDSLSHPGAPVEIITAINEVMKGADPVGALRSSLPAVLPAAAEQASQGSSAVEPGREPGIDWYKGR